MILVLGSFRLPPAAVEHARPLMHTVIKRLSLNRVEALWAHFDSPHMWQWAK